MSAKRLLGLRAYARHRGVSLSAVQKAIKSERIPTCSVKGQVQIDPEIADKAWEQNSRPTPDLEQDNLYQVSRAEKEHYLAQLAKLEYEEKMGTLLNADEVRDNIIKLVTETKDSLLGIPDRIAPELVAISDLHEMSVKLRAEINSTLTSLSRLT